MQGFPFGDGVADFKIARIVQTYHVAGISFIHHRFFIGHKRSRVGKLHLPRLAHMQVVDIALETPRTDAQEGNPVAVFGIHIGVDFEHKPTEFLLVGQHEALLCVSGQRLRRDLHKAIEQLAHPEIVDRTAKKHRRNAAFEVVFAVECRVDFLQYVGVVAQFGRRAFAHAFVQFRVR